MPVGSCVGFVLFGAVAGVAGCYEVGWVVCAAFGSWCYVVDCGCFVAAVVAGVVVAFEYVLSGVSPLLCLD